MKSSKRVLIISLVIAVVFVLWGTFLPKHLTEITSNIQDFLQKKFGWFYLLSATAFLVFVVTMIFSRFGHIKLGKDDEEPEYSYLSWFAMLFSAGMGIGLVFWGVAEPLSHYADPPLAKEGTPQAAQAALEYSLFHWGLHPWGIYTLIGLGLAYFKFRKNAPGLISSIFTPLLGDRVHGPIGRAIDILAVFATVFGVATSLGFGAVQISGGLSFLFKGIENDFGTQLVIIIIVTFLFTLSALSGLDKGIKYLSNTNVLLAVLSDAFPVLRRTYQLHDEFLYHNPGRIPAGTSPAQPPDHTFSRVGALQMDPELDHLLLGLVDRLGSLRRHLYRTHLPRADHPGVRHRRIGSSDDFQRPVVCCARRRRHLFRNVPAGGDHRGDERKGNGNRPVQIPGAVSPFAHPDHPGHPPDQLLFHHFRRFRYLRAGDADDGRTPESDQIHQAHLGSYPIGSGGGAARLRRTRGPSNRVSIIAAFPFTFIMIGIGISLYKTLQTDMPKLRRR